MKSRERFKDEVGVVQLRDKMTVIVDYGMGNVGSIVNMLKKLGIKCIISSEKEVVRNVF